MSVPERFPLRCDVGGMSVADLDTVDALARLALAAQRRGWRLVLRNVPTDLRDLLVLAGLLGPGGPLVVEARRQPEHGEHVVGVEEEGHADDLSG